MDPSLYRYVLRKSFRHQLALSAIIVVATALALVPIELQKRIVNVAIKGGNLRALVFYTVTFLAAILLAGLLKYLLNTYEALIGETLVRDLRAELLERILRLPPERVRALPAGQLSSIMLAEVEELNLFFAQAFSVPLVAGFTFVAVTGYMALLNPWLAMAALHPLQLWLIPKLQRRVTALSRERVVLFRSLSDHLQDAVRRADELDAAERPVEEMRRFAGELDRIFAVRMRTNVIKYFVKALSNFLGKFPPFLIFLVGGWLIVARPGSFDLGSLVAFLAAYDRLQEPWHELVLYYQQKEIARARYDQVLAYLAEPEQAPAAIAA
jgi:putative ABC transport system ATP-binding protein